MCLTLYLCMCISMHIFMTEHNGPVPSPSYCLALGTYIHRRLRSMYISHTYIKYIFPYILHICMYICKYHF